MLKSRQRIGDDPRDYDGHFQAPSDEQAHVSVIRPDISNDAAKSRSESPLNLFEPWNIYPKPQTSALEGP